MVQTNIDLKWDINILDDNIINSTFERYESFFKQKESFTRTEWSMVKNSDDTKILPYSTLEDFEIGRKIGSGRYGNVHVARLASSPDFVVAIKILHNDWQIQKFIAKEINILRSLNHPLIVKYFDYIVAGSEVYIITEYINGKNLEELGICKKFSEQQSASIIFDVSTALQYCHQQDILHCDVKPENIMMMSDGRCKLIDFGIAINLSEHIDPETTRGTLDYLAPEKILCDTYDEKSDVWSVGVLLYELMTGVTPFYDDEVFVTKLNIKYVFYEFPTDMDFSSEFKILIQKILKYDSKLRLSISDIIADQWIRSHI